jgi:tyrosine-protein kinase Etk/Wzc
MVHANQAAPVQITMRDFLMVIFRRKWIILSMVAVTTTVVFSALMMTPVVYTSSAKFLIWGAERGGTYDRTMMILGWEEVLASESELITSRPILESAQAMLDEQTARGEPKLTIDQGRISPSQVQKSRVLVLSYKAGEPATAQRVCEAVSTAYTEYHRSLFAPTDLGNYFRSEIQSNEDKMVDLLNRRLEVKSSNDITDVDSEIEQLTNVLVNHKINLTDVERKIAGVRAELMAARDEAPKSGVDVPYTFRADRSEGGVLVSLNQNLNSRLVEREKLLTMYTERHPEVQAVDNQIAELRAAIVREVEQVTFLKQSELTSLQAERDVLLGRIAQINERLRFLPVAERDLSEIKASLETLERQSSNLMYMDATARAGQSSMADYNVTLVSPAGKGVPSNPRDIVRMSLGPVLSLLVGIGLAFFFDNLDHSLKNPEEVERYLGLPVLTSIKRRHPRELAV